MKKYLLDMKITENIRLHHNYCLLKLTVENNLPEMRPGQFVQIKVDNSPNTFLRRPISIHYIDRNTNELWLLIQIIGEGTRKLSELKIGEKVNVMCPLGKGFTLPEMTAIDEKILLVGGGIGTAPLLYLGYLLKKAGSNLSFLLGARSVTDLVQLEQFRQIGTVYLTTEDETDGEPGFVTDHSILATYHFDRIYACGPKPMMIAIARYAHKRDIICEVSLENTMACGIGACLCCVEKTKDNHNICVCTEGPVFNINQLSWLI